jgi:hypothetical protein
MIESDRLKPVALTLRMESNHYRFVQAILEAVHLLEDFALVSTQPRGGGALTFGLRSSRMTRTWLFVSCCMAHLVLWVEGLEWLAGDSEDLVVVHE